jgi:hypothetical protein
MGTIKGAGANRGAACLGGGAGCIQIAEVLVPGLNTGST